MYMSKGEWYFGEWYFPECIFPSGILANAYFPSWIFRFLEHFKGH